MAKEYIVFLTYDEMMSMLQLAQMHLDSDGTPKILTRMPLSEEFGKDLRSIAKKLDKQTDEIGRE